MHKSNICLSLFVVVVAVLNRSAEGAFFSRSCMTDEGVRRLWRALFTDLIHNYICNAFGDIDETMLSSSFVLVHKSCMDIG